MENQTILNPNCSEIVVRLQSMNKKSKSAVLKEFQKIGIKEQKIKGY